MSSGLIQINDLITGVSKEKVIMTTLNPSEVSKYVSDFGEHATITRVYAGRGMLGELGELLEEDYDLMDVKTVVVLSKANKDSEGIEELSKLESVVGVIIKE